MGGYTIKATDHKFTQQRLAVVNGDEIPQEAHLCALHLRAVIGTNNETGIVRGEQVL
jgi:hypothetical protein